MNKDHQRPQSSPASIADLWEHACLLFHSFEWQSAIHTFLELEQDTSDPGEKCIFALNRGLIEARLGDLDLALISFFKALRFEGSNSVAHFLLGLVCAETGNYADGLMHFEHCLKSLDKNARTYRTSSGYFQLGQAIVVYNAERLRLVVAAERTRGKQIQPRLQTIPAQIIFEAPLRATETSMTDDRASTGVLHNIEPHIQFDERVRDPINQALQPTYASGHNTQSMHLVGDQDLNLIVAPGPGTQTATSPRMKLSPRDARTSGESMREISQFLRHAGPSGDSTVTVDRKYMQSLLQGSNGNSTPRHVRGQLSTSSSMTHLPGSPVSRDSDFHSLLGLYIGSPRMRRSFPLSSGTPSPTSVVYEEPMGIERSPTNVVKSPTTPHARRPSLAERWLRKEVSPALVRRPSIDQSGGGTGHQISRFHVRTASADDGESLRSAPSVVSSMQFFQVGGPLRRPGL